MLKGSFKAVTLAGTIILSGSTAIMAQSAKTDSQAAQSKSIVVEGREAESIRIETAHGKFDFTAEIADEDHERATGLMFRESMPKKHGMLFDFGKTENVYMWMRNTPLSLDMIFINSDGRVHHVVEHTTPFSEAIIGSNGPVSHVLELNAGIAKLIGVKKGSRVHHRSFKDQN